MLQQNFSQQDLKRNIVLGNDLAGDEKDFAVMVLT
jgi:hypothetical protein